MALETYRLEVQGSETGLDADVYDDEEMIEESTHVSYEDFDAAATEGAAEVSKNEAVTADVTDVDIQVQRDGTAFTFELLGDRETLATIRVDDEE
ncbi:hypothetical protein [Natronococcus occultus]|uniref:Halobacterial output domain-containing protein n=1 Tax=Natronococcus occultus SP4 TaxID=694430 RepID=L0K3Z8_9EURY|nr:hypothetical protein [Natronococcus occultus]AGB39089.1 hypothetical protein Natoc_3357 [Natronococcus occultus SP4]